jgi:hypothetical protein
LSAGDLAIVAHIRRPAISAARSAPAEKVIVQLQRFLGGEEGVVGNIEAQRHHQVVHQVLAHLGRVMHHLDAVVGQPLTITDARKHQELWAVDRPAAQHHLTAGAHNPALVVLLELHAYGAGSVENYAGRGCFGEQRQILSAQGGLEVSIGGAPPGATTLSDQGLAKPFRCSLIRSFDPVAALLGGREPRSRRTSRAALRRYGERACFDPFEVLRHLGERPVVARKRCPFVVVGGEAAHPHHRVHRRRAAEHLSSRPIDLAPVEFLLRLGHRHNAVTNSTTASRRSGSSYRAPETMSDHPIPGRSSAQTVNESHSCGITR